MALNHSGEGGEANVNSAPKQESLYSKLVREYSKTKLKDASSRSQYVTDLRAAGSITPDILQEIEKFAGKSREYDGMEITAEKINYHALVRETGSFFTTLSNNKRTIKDLYLGDYDITEQVLSQKVDTALDALTEKQVEDLISSESTRKKFLERCYGSTPLPREKSIASFLKDFNLDERHVLIKGEAEKQAFHHVVSKIRAGEKIDDGDIEDLFNTGAYNQKEKERLLNKLVPSISLAQALDYGIMTQSQADDLKKKQVQEIDNGLSKSDVDEIVSQIHDKDIRIATSQFTTHKSNREALIDNPRIFENFASKYNQMVDAAKEQIASGNMREFTTFKENLERFPSVKGIENLREGAVIQMRQKQQSTDGGMKDIILFGEILSLKDDGVIAFTEKSFQNKYDASGSKVTSESYTDFLSFIAQGNPNKGVEFESLEIMTPAQLDAQLRSGKIQEFEGKDLRLEGKQQIQASLRDGKAKIEEYKQALQDKEVQMRNDLSAQGFSQAYIDEQIESDPWILDYRNKIEQLTQENREENSKLDNLLGTHKDRLISEIDELDHEGREHGFEKGTTFKTKDGEVYTIDSLSETTSQVIVTSLYGNEPVSYEDFYRNFKEKDGKRISKQAQSFAELIERVKLMDGQTAWDKFEEKSGTIKKKDVKGGSSDYEYLVQDRNAGSELIHIHNISGDKVTISFGTIEEKDKKDKKGKEARGADGHKVKDSTFKVEKREYIVTTGFLEDYIREKKLEPRSLKESTDVSDQGENVGPMKKNFHFFSWMFHERATINDAIKGGKIFFEQMKEMIEMGSEEKANQFALKYMGRFLTKDARRDLQSRLEQKQKKTMEDYLDRLKTVASDVALEMIEQWLQDKYGNQFQKEAAVVFMLEKYGVLNAKSMKKHEGQWWWYQALGGKIGDPFFNEIKAEQESKSLPFTEELLVYLLLKKQCKPEGFNGIKRRSKLHKEVKKLRATGKEEEIETGRRDGADERDIMGRVNGGMDEMKSGNYPNMVGWLEKAIDKGGPMHVMNKIPFCAAFSGVAYSFEEKITDTLKSFPGSTRIMMMLRFFSYHRDLDLLNNTILEVCKSLQEKGYNSTIGIDAQELFDLRRNPAGGLEKRLERAETFYNKHGEIITKIMYGLNTGDKDDIYNKMIFFEKDDATNPERAKVFSNYFNALTGFFRATETNLSSDDHMTDAFLHAGTSGMDMHKVTEDLMIMRQGAWNKKHSGPTMWEEVEKELRAIPHRKYSDDPVENEKMQMQLLKYNLQGFISGIIKQIQNGRELAGYNAATGPFTTLNKWGIDMTKFESIQGFNVEELLEGHSHASDKIIEKFASNIINAETKAETFYHEVNNEFTKESNSADTIGESINSTKEKVSRNTIPPGNDYYDNMPAPANNNL